MYNVIAEDAIYSKQVPILVRLLKCTHILASFRSPAMLATSCLQALLLIDHLAYVCCTCVANMARGFGMELWGFHY